MTWSPGASKGVVDVLSSEDVRAEGVDTTFLVWLTARATADLVDSTVAADGLTSDEFAVYSMLASSTDVTPSTLVRWMAAPATTVSSYVKRFEARGHVRRETDPRDRRSYRIELTEAGRQAHRRAQASFTPVRAALASALGDDEVALREALLRLREALDLVRAAEGVVGPTS